MKKYLFLLMISGLLISCGNVGEAEEKTSETTYVEVEEKSIYKEFEEENLIKYIGDGIIDIVVAPYSKGIDILFTTDTKDFSKEKFEGIAKEVVKNFKENFDIDESLEIGVSLDYQPDPSENAENIFVDQIQ
jgi:hypothetical protein